LSGFEMLAIDAAAGADVITHPLEPSELIGADVIPAARFSWSHEAK